MKINLYLSTAVAGLMMFGGEAYGQCVSSQDCASLGYTKSSCPDGNGVKCPFGNAWFCVDQCGIGFKYTCTGTGYGTQPASAACNGKYTSCVCADKYTWSGTACTKCASKYTEKCNGSNETGGADTGCGGYYAKCSCATNFTWNTDTKSCEANTANCVIGALYYVDGTCSNDYISSKKLLGIVIYEKSASQNGWVMTHKPIATGIEWGGFGTDIPGLTNITSESSLTDIQASCTNTDKITAQGNSSAYPAAWAAKNYKEGGKTWCLPSGGLLKNALDNSANFTKFNAAVYKIQASAGTSAATILGNVSGGYETVWSSSESSGNYAWDFRAGTSGSFNMGYYAKYDDSSYDSVRPVLAF